MSSRNNFMFLVFLLLTIVSSIEASTTLIRGLIFNSLPLPNCSIELAGYIHFDGTNARACNGDDWLTIAVDRDGDGITSLIDENDNLASDKGDSDLIPSNIRHGKEIFNVTGNLVERSSLVIPSSVIGIPGTSNRSVRYTLNNGIYEGRSVSFTIPGDSDLIAGNIKSGVILWDGKLGAITGSYTATNFSTRSYSKSSMKIRRLNPYSGNYVTGNLVSRNDNLDRDALMWCLDNDHDFVQSYTIDNGWSGGISCGKYSHNTMNGWATHARPEGFSGCNNTSSNWHRFTNITCGTIID